MGTPQFMAATGCLPPCTYEEYLAKVSPMEDTLVMKESYGEKAVTLMVSRESTETKIIK